MIFRQLFDSESSTYTYLLADTDTKEAVLIDPVIEKSERDAKLVGELGLSVKFVMNTHVHADHITGTGRLKVKSPLSNLKRKSLLFLETAPRLPVSSISCQWREGGYSSKGNKNMKRNSLHCDIGRPLGQDGERIQFGGCSLLVAETPGHTAGCITYIDSSNSRAFTGDALLIRGCGRTDFQGGSAETLYRSVWSRILSLPDHFSLYPAHDYKAESTT